MHKNLFSLTSILPLVFFLACTPEKHDAETREMKRFIDNLMKEMTLEEKIGQLTLYSSYMDETGPFMNEDYLDYIREGRVGAVFNAFTADYTREIQRIAVEETRLGIPLLFGYDVIHGHRTIFPMPIGETATWDMEAIKKSAQIAAREATAEGLHWTFSPMIDVTRDPRWGRIAESSGEDPFLTAEVARAKVRGYQGDDLKDLHTMLATAKHFAAYGAPQAGRDYHTVDMSEITLRNKFLPPFKATVEEGVATFMTAFNDLFAVPATGSEFLLTQILRDEWGFEGFVVTDYTSINEMVPHGFARDEKHAGKLAINAGTDMDMQGSVFYNYLAELVAEGKVSESRIDEAARRILTMKYKLGLFDDPYRYSDPEREKEMIMTAENLEFARDFARKSIVLLKNENNTLPLSDNIRSIALIGPMADNQRDLIGSWSAAGDYTKSVTLLQGLKNRLGSQTQVNYAKGTDVIGEDKSGFPQAIRAAAISDVVIMALGEHYWQSGEAASRSIIDLPGVQEDLFNEIVKLGKPVVVVLMNGRPLTIENVDAKASAILETWFLGTTAGDAIADVLFGDYNPSGKLPVTFPRNVGQIPIFYNVKNTGRPKTEFKFTSKYLDVPNTPLYPFGFGLSYTTFEYSDINLSSNQMPLDGSLNASVTVTNTGDRFGEEVVQLYIRQLVGSITRPIKELKAFEKIALEPGESREVTFELNQNHLAFYNANNEFKAEPGEFHLFIGTNSEDVKKTSFTLME
ncbi:MAG: glycosyl hydrolase [Bacteroidetes bacterium]|nr:MAG: glycosyl hydrolase [Bacteroidota bacterium]